MAALKAYIGVTVICPGCSFFMQNVWDDKKTPLLTCSNEECEYHGKLYDYPIVEVKEHESKN